MPRLGLVHLVRATAADCARIDAEWSSLRRPEDVHQAWLWSEMIQTMRDAFVLVGDAPLAIWGSAKGSPIELPEGRFYRLDYLECHPSLRGQGVAGLFALATIAKRARELDAAGIVLAAFNEPKLVEFYVGAGAEQRQPRGWTVPRNLIPCVFGAVAVDSLETFADAHDDDESAAEEGA